MKRNILLFVLTFFYSSLLFCQEVETLFGGTENIKTRWTFDVRSISIQKNLSTSIGVSFGTVFSNNTGAAFSVFSNLSHTFVNHGGIACDLRYYTEPHKLLHWNGKVSFGLGVVKDYEQTKSNAFDNFGNIFGTGFYFIEPGIEIEVNASKSLRINTGIAYRLSTGVNTTDSSVILYRPTNGDLSGITVNVSFIFE